MNKPKSIKQKYKIVAINSNQNKDKGIQINEKQSVDLSSVSTSASAPIKTIFTNVNRRNQQTDFADKLVINKAETNIVKIEMPFSLKQEISKIKISVPLTELVTQDVYRSQILKAFNIGENNDIVNLNDD